MKKCNKCKIIKPIKDFYKYCKSRSHRGDGHEATCKDCIKSHAKTDHSINLAKNAKLKRMEDPDYKEHVNSLKRKWQRNKYATSEEFRKISVKKQTEWSKTPRGKILRAASMKRYQQTLKYKKAINKYRKNNPEKRSAQIKVANAIQSGKLLRPDKCSICNFICTPEGHHPNYSEPLNVIWMCKRCHTDYHMSAR